MEKRPPFNLSRLLFPIDELRATFTTSLLTAAPLDQCIFWIAEVHSSGWSPFPLLWEIYFDFYALTNPSLFDFIQKKERVYNTTITSSAVVEVVKNMRTCEWTLDAFAFKQLVAHKIMPKHVYRGQPMLNIRDLIGYTALSKSVQRFIMAWNLGRWDDIAAYLGRLVYEEGTQLTLEDIAGLLYKLHPDKTPNIMSGNIGSLIVYMLSLRKDIVALPKRRMLATTQEKELWDEYLGTLDHAFALDRYDVMSHRVKYGINPKVIGAFYLGRDVLDDIVDQWRNFGEYYCKDCPYWNVNMSTCQCNNSIWETDEPSFLRFDDDDMEEEFYDRHWLHPDEQNEEIINKVIPKEEGGNCESWIAMITQSKTWSEGTVEVPRCIEWCTRFPKLYH